jgi:hypothetical protein
MPDEPEGAKRFQRQMSLEQIEAFLKGNEEVGFQAPNRKELYEWTHATLCARGYISLHRSGKGPGETVHLEGDGRARNP